MTKKLTPEQKKEAADAKAAAKTNKKMGAVVAGDLTQVEGSTHVVEFDHTFDDSEPVYNEKGQYTGHDKQVRTTVHHTRTFPNVQLAEMFEKNHIDHPEHGVSNIVIRKA